jgi:D-glycero-D-manno-heptose 1,7-bisphosphate phosphatase
MVKTVFLDRDGVINELVQRNVENHPAQYITAPWKQDEFKFIPGAILAISRFKTMGMMVIVVTNQPDVKDGNMQIETLEKFNQKLLDIGVDDVICALDRNNPDYKPGNGMLETMISKYNIDRNHAVLIGDRWKDIVAGYSSRIKTIYCSEQPYKVPMEYSAIAPDYNAKNLLQASVLIEGI